MKKAQISLFLLFSLVVIIAAAFFVYLNSTSLEQQSRKAITQTAEMPAQIQPLNSFVEDCLRSTIAEAINLVSFQGGYYSVPEPYTTLSGIEIPYYWHENLLLVPTKSMVEEQLSAYLEEMLPSCTNGFAAFKELGYTVSEGSVSASAVIAAEEVMADVNYPLKLSKESSSFSLETFHSRVGSTIYSFLDSATGIVDEIDRKPDYVPLSFIVGLGAREGFTAEIIHQDNGSVIFSLIDNDSQLPPKIYVFAVKYDWEKETEKLVEIASMPEQNATIGYWFSYKVAAKGSGLQFHDYTDMFDINGSTGVIGFLPKMGDRGLHRVLVKAQDQDGNEDRAFMTITVLSENDPPRIKPIQDQTLAAGIPFTYLVVAYDPNNDSLFYNVETELQNFKVGLLTGEISFTPAESQKGAYNVTIVVVDINGAVAKQTFKVTIK